MATAETTVLGEANTTVRGKLARLDLTNRCFYDPERRPMLLRKMRRLFAEIELHPIAPK